MTLSASDVRVFDWHGTLGDVRDVAALTWTAGIVPSRIVEQKPLVVVHEVEVALLDHLTTFVPRSSCPTSQ